MNRLLSVEMLEMAIILLKFLREANHSSKALITFRIVNCSLLLLTGTFIFANFFHASGTAFIKSLQALIAILHIFLKYLTLIHNKSRIEALLSDTTTFWNYRNFDNNIRETILKIVRAVIKLQKLMLAAFVLALYLYFLRPLFDVNYIFLLETWIPESSGLSAVLLASQFYCFCIGVPIVFSYDLIYLVLCVHVALEMKLLKYRIKEILEKQPLNCRFRLRECIEHHQFLQAMFLRMKGVFSVMLLFHYFVTLISTCSDMYEVLVGDSDLTSVIIKFWSIVIFFVQFAYYTFPAEQVAFEFSDLADSLYSSKWHTSTISIQKTVLIAMLRSQRLQFFSGAGLMDINIYTFGSVVRKTLSFYAVLRNLINK